jgi:hypothetical protein
MNDIKDKLTDIKVELGYIKSYMMEIGEFLKEEMNFKEIIYQIEQLQQRQ